MDEFSDFPSSTVRAAFQDAMKTFNDIIRDPSEEDFDEENPDNEPPPEPFTDALMQLLPPPTENKHWPTFAALFRAVNLHDARQGYATSKAGNRKNRNGDIAKIWLKCTRGGKYKDKVDLDLAGAEAGLNQ